MTEKIMRNMTQNLDRVFMVTLLVASLVFELLPAAARAQGGAEASLAQNSVSRPQKVVKSVYPQINTLEGDAQVLQKGQVLTGKLDGKVLREQVLVRTQKGRVRIDLADDEFVIVAENSEFLIPSIDWESGAVEEFELLKGSVGIELKKPRQMRSSVYRDKLGEGRYLFDFTPGIPQFGVTVLAGSLDFRGLESEQRSLVARGERQVFIGEITDGAIQYDVLLEGRKVARGKLTTKQVIPDATLASFNKGFDLDAKKTAKAKAAIAAVKKAKRVKEAGGPGLCKKPRGMFNDCSYTCLNNPKGQKVCAVDRPGVSCVRHRCLANGEWGDEFVYAPHLSICDKSVFVRPCDY